MINYLNKGVSQKSMQNKKGSEMIDARIVLLIIVGILLYLLWKAGKLSFLGFYNLENKFILLIPFLS